MTPQRFSRGFRRYLRRQKAHIRRSHRDPREAAQALEELQRTHAARRSDHSTTAGE
ncbi:MAG: hypothetical protein HY341_01365 [Candidatus Kerfeldbacteria bacterium]|nr:hypothetical protein [Candidatus Kerfeldbacteria bacterium]